MFQKDIAKKKHIDFLLMAEEEKKNYVLVNDFNRFMYDHSLHRRRKHFYRYCLRILITEGMLKCHTEDCFKIDGKEMIKMPKNG